MKQPKRRRRDARSHKQIIQTFNNKAKIQQQQPEGQDWLDKTVGFFNKHSGTLLKLGGAAVIGGYLTNERFSTIINNKISPWYETASKRLTSGYGLASEKYQEYQKKKRIKRLEARQQTYQNLKEVQQNIAEERQAIEKIQNIEELPQELQDYWFNEQQRKRGGIFSIANIKKVTGLEPKAYTERRRVHEQSKKERQTIIKSSEDSIRQQLKEEKVLLKQLKEIEQEEIKEQQEVLKEKQKEEKQAFQISERDINLF